MTSHELARRCPICGVEDIPRIHHAREMMFGTRERFDYRECPACGTLQIAAVPADLERHYPSGYYTGGAAAGRPGRGFGWLAAEVVGLWGMATVSNGTAWYQAGKEVERTLATLETLEPRYPAGAIVLVDGHDTWRGAYVWRNGFINALRRAGLRADLDWRLGELDKHSQRVLVRTFDAELRRLGRGSATPSEWLSDPDPQWPIDYTVGNHPFANYHQLGGTRTGSDPAESVVDADCRVHGYDNLYVAGGSVFPTSGWANPTLTIVALALRTADHLIEKAKP